MKKKGQGVKKWMIAIGIAIVFSLFINYGISTFYDEPDFNDYRPEGCQDYEDPRLVLKTNDTEPYKPECDEWQNKEFKEVREKYERNVFIMLVIAGLIGIVLGITLRVEAVSFGLLLGGIFTLFFGTIRYWGNLFDFARFLILGAVLAILIWIGYKKLK